MHAAIPSLLPGRAGGKEIGSGSAAFPRYFSQGMGKDAPMLHKLNKSVVTGSYSGACVKGQ